VKKRVYGPYKGSKQNKGRAIYVIKKGGKTTSTNRARLDHERATGRKLPRSVHVDHKDNNKDNHSKSNLQAMRSSKNIAKGNTARKGTKYKKKKK
jgi:hypothetical protein